MLGDNWALVKGCDLSCHNKETELSTKDPQYGNLNKNPLSKSPDKSCEVSRRGEPVGLQLRESTPNSLQVPK